MTTHKCKVSDCIHLSLSKLGVDVCLKHLTFGQVFDALERMDTSIESILVSQDVFQKTVSNQTLDLIQRTNERFDDFGIRLKELELIQKKTLPVHDGSIRMLNDSINFHDARLKALESIKPETVAEVDSVVLKPANALTDDTINELNNRVDNSRYNDTDVHEVLKKLCRLMSKMVSVLDKYDRPAEDTKNRAILVAVLALRVFEEF